MNNFCGAVYPVRHDDEIYFISDAVETGEIAGIGKIVDIRQMHAGHGVVCAQPVDDRAKLLFKDDPWFNQYPEPDDGQAPDAKVARSMWRAVGICFSSYSGMPCKSTFTDEPPDRHLNTRIVGKAAADNGWLSLDFEVQPPTLEARISNLEVKIHQRTLLAVGNILNSVGIKRL